jgi:hypothetical protein
LFVTHGVILEKYFGVEVLDFTVDFKGKKTYRFFAMIFAIS